MPGKGQENIGGGSMSFKKFVKKMAKEYKKSQKPENIKKRLKDKIATAKLKGELAELEAKQRKKEADKWNFKIGGE